MKTLLVICFGKLQHDARVSRQIDFLKNTYKVTIAVFDTAPDYQVEFVKIKRPALTPLRKAIIGCFLMARMHTTAYRLLHGHAELKEQLAGRRFDLIVANDIESLPLAFEINPDGNVLFDAHEYAPRHFEDKFSWRIFFQPFNQYLCRKYIPKVKAMTTVGTGLAEEYKKHFHIDPVIITNATAHTEINASPTVNDKVRMIHHGGATVSRRLEIMIELMRLLDDRFTLDLMLIVPEFASSKTKNYINYLRTLAENNPRINFLPPLKSHEIVGFINKYDIGLFLLPPVNFNYANTLPNKLFDFIQARLCIAIGPTPEMAQLVRHYDMGVVAREFTAESLAVELMNLTNSGIQRMKGNASKAARELTAENNKEKLLDLIQDILTKSEARGPIAAMPQHKPH